MKNLSSEGLQFKERVKKETFTCDMCKKRIYNKFSYRIQNHQYIPDWIPRIMYPICRTCLYKENYGNKFYRKYMKERTLDDQEKK